MSGITQNWRCWCSSLVVASVLIASLQEHTFAQITPDNTLPNNSSVAKEGSTFNITGGTQAGSNLFHSFREFSVPNGGIASFNNALDIQNIISRVTGGSASDINGLIRASGKANLFLINPNGIIFGQGARLDIGGSFVGTTANAIGFGERGFFSATNPNTPQLLTVNPSAFLFNQIAAAPIKNNSIAFAEKDPAGYDAFGLRVLDGKSLLLVGGNVSMDGGELNAYGGRVELGGLSEPGTVLLGVDGDNLSLRFPENVTRADISLTNGAGVFVEAAGGGNIAVNARNLEILGATTILSAGIGQGLGTPETVAGDIALNATGEIKVTSGSVVFNDVNSGSRGNGGNITIDSGSLSLQNGAQLDASTSGQGNAGNVTVSAKDAVSLADAYIFSRVESGAVGKAGNIDINAATLSLDDVQLDASTSGQGNAGNVTVSAKDAVSLVDAYIFSTVESGAVGKAGNIDINAATLSLDDAQLEASTFGQGNAGNVTVSAKDDVSLADTYIFSRVESEAVGKGGDIDINAATLSLIDGAVLDASTFGQGNAGNVRIRASGAITFDRAGAFSTVKDGSVGNGGDIDVTTGSLSLTNLAALNTTTYGEGKAGNVKIRASGAITFDGANEEGASGVQSSVGPTGMGDGGNIDIQSSYLSLTGGAELISGVFQGGQGKSGNITVNVKNSINLSGVSTKDGSSSGLFTDPEDNSKGQGGEILLSADVLKISDGATLSARTRNAFRGGNIIINVNSLDLTGGGQILTAAFDKGNAGNIIINATKGITISGSDPTFDARLAQFGRPFVDPVNSLSGLFANTDVNSTGQGGNITITTGQLQVQNQAQVTVNSEGEDVAGILDISANTVKLNNGSIIAQTRFGNGGNLTLDVKDLLLLRNSSQISTTAGDQQNGGNGGNITIKAPNGFILAVPSENSDITANAFTGSGGRVDIQATGIYGIEFRESPTGLSDITASSEFGTQGTVELNTPDVDPDSGLVQLPTIPVDTQVAQGCYSPDYAQNRFVIVGRGGLPPNPQDILTPDAPQIDWVSVKPTNKNRSIPPVTTNPTTSTPKRIVEATGATLNAKGQIVLSANSSAAPYTFRHNPIQCHGR